MRLQGKTVLVTGAASGIGRGIALRLASEGANVVVAVHRLDERSEQVCKEIREAGVQAWLVQGDVGGVGEVQRLFREATEAAGSIDALINNAGIEIRAPFGEVTEQDYDRVLNVNLKGPFFLSQQFVHHCKQQRRGGKIVNISSVHEDLPFPNFTSYCVSKGGLRMLMRNLAIELAPHGITVNNIAPGAIQTPIHQALQQRPDQLRALLANIPLNRLGEPGDVAGLAAFLCSADADYITGATLVIDGGLLWNYSEQ